MLIPDTEIHGLIIECMLSKITTNFFLENAVINLSIHFHGSNINSSGRIIYDLGHFDCNRMQRFF